MNEIVLDRLSRQDAQILRLSRGHIRGHTAKVMILAPSEGATLPELDAIRARVAARLHLVPRFRRRIVPTPFRLAEPVWADDPDFDIQRHVEVVAAGEELDLDGVERAVASLLTKRLDRAHPLWHLGIVPRVTGGRMALVWRVHHALADGTSCVRIASALLWDRIDDDGSEDPAAWRPAAPPSGSVLVRSGLGQRFGALRPRRGPSGSLRALPALPAVLRREFRRDAAITPLAAAAGPRRTVAFASLSLAGCHDAGKAIDERVTVNDVVLATLAGALREWLPGPLTAEDRIRVKVPVSLHGAGDEEANHDSYFFTELPVHESDPVGRVLAVSRDTRERKLHHDAEALYHLGLHPAFAHAVMSPHVFTFNVSNVPGPRGPVSMLGATITDLYSLAEIADQHALRVAIISLAGRLFFGLNGDSDAVGDLPALAAAIERAGAELTTASR